MQIVTGASNNHFRSLLQFLQSLPSSAIEHTWVWDFGLSAENLNVLHNTHINVRLRRFPYNEYPSWFDIRVATGEYAWKPVAIWRTALEVATDGEVILWCDAGNRLVGGHEGLRVLEAVIRRQGVYSPISSGTVQQWTHPGCMAWFNIRDEVLNASPRNGAIIGFDLNQGAAWHVLEEWAALAQQKDCIAPAGSSRANHRQDQAVFTLLYYTFTGSEELCRDPIHLLTHQDVE